MQINPYLTFDGTCEAALNFYAQVFNSKVGDIHRYAGSPMADQMPAEFHNKVMHGNVVIQNIVLMGSDANPHHPYEGLKGVQLSISIDGTAEAERIFNALAEGGQVTMPLAETFWAARFGMLVDQFGTPWMVNCDHKQ